jgi:hypothetical protein
MRVFVHFNARLLRPLITVLAIMGVVMSALLSYRSTGHASAPAATTFQGSPATVALAASSHFALNGPAQQPISNGQGARHPIEPRHGVTTTSISQSQAPQVADIGVVTGVGQLLHNFNGLNNVNHFHVNGFVLEPPDQGLCTGQLLGSKVVGEIINDVVTFYTPNGALFSPEEDLNTFFHEPGPPNSPTAEILTDPRCYFDPTTQTWFFTSLALAPTATFLPNHVDILVLNTSLSAEFIYRVDVTFANNTAGGCPCLGDQPKLGIDKNNLYITVDQFNTAETLETGDSLLALSKSQLVAGKPVVNIAEFHNLSLGGIGVLTLQPAITNSNSDIEYLLNSFPFADEAGTMPNTISKLLGLWALSDTGAVTTGAVPKLSARIITSEVYGFPVPALTTNGLSLATFSNDSRMQQVQFINGHLWGALDSAVAVNHDPVTRDGAAWFEIQPIVDSNGTVTGAQFTDQGYVAVAGKFLAYPAITTTFEGTTGIAFSITSPTLNPSTGYAVRKAGSATFGGIHLTAIGSRPDIGFTCALGAPQQCRWGDYSWSALDPNGQNLWMAAEKTVSQVSTQVIKGHAFKINWGTQVWDVMGNQ